MCKLHFSFVDPNSPSTAAVGRLLPLVVFQTLMWACSGTVYESVWRTFRQSFPFSHLLFLASAFSVLLEFSTLGPWEDVCFYEDCSHKMQLSLLL